MTRQHPHDIFFPQRLLVIISDRFLTNKPFNEQLLVLEDTVMCDDSKRSSVFYDLCAVLPPPFAGPGSQRDSGSGTLSLWSRKD